MIIRATRTIIKEYKVDKEHYPEGSTPQEILNLDQKGLEEEFFEDVDFDAVVLKIVEE